MKRITPERFSPQHYAPEAIPAVVQSFAGAPNTLVAGSPGKIGLLELGFERVGERTELVRRFQKSPLQLMRPLYVDPARPDLPVAYVMSTGGGIVQADRLRLDVECGADTAVLVTTQAATRLYSMDSDFATQLVHLRLGPRAWLEYLPESIIPHPRARFYQRTSATVDPTATLVIGEVVMAGRLARGERHQYDVLALDTEVADPDGTPFAVDRIRLCPVDSSVTGPGVWGDHTLIATLFVVSPLAPAAALADALHAAVTSHSGTYHTVAGVSVLPDDRGAWVRILGSDSPTLQLILRRAWDAARQTLLGVPAPMLRKT